MNITKHIRFIKQDGDNYVFAYKQYSYFVSLVLPIVAIPIIIVPMLAIIRLPWYLCLFILLFLYIILLSPISFIRDGLNKKVERFSLLQIIPVTDDEISREYYQEPKSEDNTNTARFLRILYDDNHMKVYQVEELDMVDDVIILRVVETSILKLE